MESSSSSSMITNGIATPGGIQMENPFTFKVGQVFTGFGIGCGLGIGVGRPLNLGAIPMLGQVMSATRGATDAFSGVGRHVNTSLRKLGAKNIEAGIGCGIGFGHGFGVGLAVKPSVVHQLQSCLMQAMTMMMMKFGLAPNMFIGHGSLPIPLQSGLGMTAEPSHQKPMESIMKHTTKVPDQTYRGQPRNGNMKVGSSYKSFASNGPPLDTSFGSCTEEVINNFLQNPLLNEGDTQKNGLAGRLQSENSILQLVLKHQQMIGELMEENEKLRQILLEDLKVPPSKLQASYSPKNKYPCTDCFECRRKQRRK